MYEASEKWADYYAELDPARRLALYHAAADPESDEDAFIAALYRERYQDPKHPGRQVDSYLWKCVYLPGLYKKRRVSRGAFRREVAQTLADLHLDAGGALSEAEARALYLEYRNAARRYLGTCLGRRYGSRMFGLREASLAEKKAKASEEIWMMSRGIARAAGKEAEMRLFCDALREELAVFYPGYGTIFEELEQKHGGEERA